MGLLKLSPTEEVIAAWAKPQTQDIVKQPVAEGKLPGLANLGNTCFANSVLQCLLNTPGWFPEACLAFSKFDGTSQSKKAALGRAFQRLAGEYGAAADGALPKTNASLRNMKDAIAAIDPQYAGCQQQDAYEFLGCLLEGLEEGFGVLFRGAALLRDEEAPTLGTPNADVIRAICGVTTLTRRVCHSCSGCFEVDRVTDTALRLPLLSPAAQFDPALRVEEERTPVTLEELLDITRRPETIEGYDCDACRACSAQDGTQHARSAITQHAGIIAETRDVIVVVLYRFGHAVDKAGNFQPVKVKRQVACPSELKIDSKAYKLFGVVSHLGTSLSAGHYVAAVRSRRDGVWYECNDEAVRPLNLTALYDGRSVTSVKPGAEPYILFYHREAAEANSEAVPAETEPVAAEETLRRSAVVAEATQANEVPIKTEVDDGNGDGSGEGAAVESASPLFTVSSSIQAFMGADFWRLPLPVMECDGKQEEATKEERGSACITAPVAAVDQDSSCGSEDNNHGSSATAEASVEASVEASFVHEGFSRGEGDTLKAGVDAVNMVVDVDGEWGVLLPGHSFGECTDCGACGSGGVAEVVSQSSSSCELGAPVEQAGKACTRSLASKRHALALKTYPSSPLFRRVIRRSCLMLKNVGAAIDFTPTGILLEQAGSSFLEHGGY